MAVVMVLVGVGVVIAAVEVVEGVVMAITR